MSSANEPLSTWMRVIVNHKTHRCQPSPSALAPPWPDPCLRLNPELARRDTPVNPLRWIPSMSAESLVLLCPKTACLDTITSYGARRPEEIAIALAGLSDRVFLFGLYTVVNDRSVQPQVVYYAHLEVVDLAIARGWRAPKGSMVWRKMALLALCEVIGLDCSRGCKRRGDISEQEAVPAKCPECDGTGLRRFTAAEREETLGMKGRRWLFRYELAYRRIAAWQTTLEDHLRRGLRAGSTDARMGFAVAV